MNVSRFKTPAGVAKNVHKYLQKQAESLGSDPKNVMLWSPEKASEMGYGSGWQVVWEEGPYEWAFGVSAGESLYAGETGIYGGKPAIDGLIDHPSVLAEPYNGHILSFFEN